MGRPKKSNNDKALTNKEIERIDKMLSNIDNNLVARDKGKRKNMSTNEQKIKRASVINNMLSEYMDSYMVIGYDTNEKKVVIVNATTPMQHDALLSLLEKVANRLVGNDLMSSEEDEEFDDD